MFPTRESASAAKPSAALPSSSASSSSEARKEADVLVPPVKFGIASPMRSNLPDKAPAQATVVKFGATPLLVQPPSAYNSSLGRIPVVAQTAQTVPRPSYTVFPSGSAVPSAGSAHNPWVVEPTTAGFVDLTARHKAAAATIGQHHRSAPAVNDVYGVGLGGGPDDFVAAEAATESIKALLQGAVDDDDEDEEGGRKKRKNKGRAKAKKKDGKAAAKDVNELVAGVQGLKVDKKDGDAAAQVQSEEAKDENVKGEPKDGENEEGEEEEEEEDDEDEGVVDGLRVRLLPHQVDGLEWMTDKEIGKRRGKGVLPNGGILADDMGLGKTLQSISLILTNPRPSPTSPEYAQRKLPQGLEKMTLVVAPLALIRQWEAEIKDKVSSSRGMRVCVHHGAKRTKRYQDLRRYDVVITTYQVLVSELRASASEDDGIKVGCFGLHWYRVILDEAHQIKNRNAQAAQACYALQAQYRWCLTGTPMQNNLDELQSLIRFLRIQPYNNLAVWREMITNPLKNGRGGVAIKRLKVVLKAFMKRRTKDVLKRDGALGRAGGKPAAAGGSKDGGAAGAKQPAFKITERRVEEIAAEFSPAEREFYERLEKRTDERLEQLQDDGGISYANALVLLLRLRQACNHPQLVAGKLAKDADSLAVDVVGPDGKENRKAKSGASNGSELDDVADLFGGLSVENRTCEVCLADLSAEMSSRGALRCASCESYIDDMRKSGKGRRPKGKKRKEASSGRAKKSRAIVLDSDDEDGGDHNSAADDEQKNGDEVDDGGSDGSDCETESQVDDEEGDDAGSLGALVASTKIKRLMKLLHAEVDDHKFIVFSQFTTMLDLIEPFLHRDGLVFTRYDGKMRNDQREASLDRLRKDDRTRILLCSLKCGSLGLNLTAASRVIIIEPFYNPFVEEQAIDRVHRINQTVDVVVYKLTIARSVEERILELQAKKRELANATIEGKLGAKLSLNDILKLFRRDGASRPADAADLALANTVARGGVLGALNAVNGREDKPLVHAVSQPDNPTAGKRKGGGGGGGGRPFYFKEKEDTPFSRRW